MSTLPFRGGGALGASRGMLSVAKSLPRSRAATPEALASKLIELGCNAQLEVLSTALASTDE